MRDRGAFCPYSSKPIPVHAPLPATLTSLLRKKGWSSSLVGGHKDGCRGFAFFYFNIDLTEEGLEQVEEVILLVFQYLALLGDAGPQEQVTIAPGLALNPTSDNYKILFLPNLTHAQSGSFCL